MTTPVITGAVAAKLQPVEDYEELQPALKTGHAAPLIWRPIQAQLFEARPESKVVSIARYAPQPEPKPRPRSETATHHGTAKSAARKSKPTPEGQGTLDFLPPLPAKPRELGSTVEAVMLVATE